VPYSLTADFIHEEQSLAEKFSVRTALVSGCHLVVWDFDFFPEFYI
jgi:hypothetical protein